MRMRFNRFARTAAPADEKRPAGAREAMAALDLDPGAGLSVFVDASRKSTGLPLIVYDGR